MQTMISNIQLLVINPENGIFINLKNNNKATSEIWFLKHTAYFSKKLHINNLHNTQKITCLLTKFTCLNRQNTCITVRQLFFSFDLTAIIVITDMNICLNHYLIIMSSAATSCQFIINSLLNKTKLWFSYLLCLREFRPDN